MHKDGEKDDKEDNKEHNEADHGHQFAFPLSVADHLCIAIALKETKTEEAITNQAATECTGKANTEA